MKLLLIQGQSIQKFVLPETVDGNYWVSYRTSISKQKDLVNVESENGKWKMNANQDVQIFYQNQIVPFSYLEEYNYYFLKVIDDEVPMILYVEPTYEKNFISVVIKNKQDISIGSANQNAIVYPNGLLEPVHAKFSFVEGAWHIINMSTHLGTFLNDSLVTDKVLSIGDIVFVGGIQIIFMDTFLVVSNHNNLVRFSNEIFDYKGQTQYPYQGKTAIDLAELELYKETDFFRHTPRLRTKIESEVIEIDDPPARETMGEMPWLLTVGPMLMMAMTSIMSGTMGVIGLVNGTATWLTALPSLVMCVSMLAGSLLFPALTRRYTKKMKKKKEELRQKKYRQYLVQKEAEISLAWKSQKQILLENLLTLEECQSIILNKKRNLWEREIFHDDFLKVRLGVGNVPLQVQINYSKEKFSLEDDDLKATVKEIVNKYAVIPNVPISMSFADKYINTIMGDDSYKDIYMKGLILQLITFHSYSDLKLVFLMNHENDELYNYIRFLPHCWNEDKSVRFFATNLEEMKDISSYLEGQFTARRESMQGDNGEEKKNFDYHNFSPYYIIITDNYEAVQNLGIINSILDYGRNIGFGLTIIANQLAELPNGCSSFLYVTKKSCGLFENELVSDKQKQFVPDEIPFIDMTRISKVLSNIPIIAQDETSSLPKMLTFLEMYNAGKIEQLNILNRWKTSNPMMNLAVPVGVYPNGELFKLDLHEKFHGPHGLIAGSTGSGKSEFIITYILSMAVNFHPDEVQFVLIDYKGGGLAGAFENRETGLKLPHLAGTITNLDTVEMKRSLASIQSELRRRQREFNKARDSLNESTIDIYKYQKLYREGLVKGPISHLFIISDEFAELKSQQPEFMAQLVSTARIGRSLGVHLILATQKPSGVVNDQIWSNSKFKVCLKVQEKSDSMEMIKRPDAAAIKETGRFYLQVGYNEFFALGQSAWSGAKYYPTEKVKRKLDDSLCFVNHVGYVEKNMNTTKVEVKKDQGEQLPNIVNALVDLAGREKIQVKQLWLNRIPEYIYLLKLKEKYNYIPEALVINPIIGEYDDPNNQQQGLLTLDITNQGNALIYGMSGSGKENLLQTIIYGISIFHSPEEVNFYIIDFGTEVLKSFIKYPQVGDVVTIEETEKLVNLFRMIDSEIERRKDLFIDYNGNYLDYCRGSKEILPQIIILLNNFEVFSETYGMSEFEESLVKFTRSGNKYGINFILTANTANGVRYKLSQNFTQMLVLQMTNPSDYTTLLGKTEGVIPSKFMGRGLVKQETVFEFQTAYIDEKDQIVEAIKVMAQKLRGMTSTYANRIPVLPETVTYDLLAPSLTTLDKIPVGIDKSSLETITFDFASHMGNVITARNFASLKSKMLPLLRMLMKFGTLVVTDPEHVIDPSNLGEAIYYADNFDEITIKINADANYRNEIIAGTVTGTTLENMPRILWIVLGVKKYIEGLSDDGKLALEHLVEVASKIEGAYTLVFVDTADNLKAVEYDSWYKSITPKTHGIWIGSGLDSQFLFQIENMNKEMRESITDSFGYTIVNGVAKSAKLLDTDPEGKDDIG